MRSPSKGKVAGSIPAGALLFMTLPFVFYTLILYVWSRGAMETRLPPKQKIVGSTPTGIVFMTFYTDNHIYRDIHTYTYIYLLI